MKRFFIFMCLFIFLFPSFVLAKSTVVMDMDSGRVLYESKSDKKSLIASITKVMTCIIVLEKGNLDDVVIVGDEVLPMYGTNIYLEVGESISIRDLLYGLMLRSGNDSAVVLAKYISGSEEEFVKVMNSYATRLGMVNTTFSNAHGLDDTTKNYSTAYDMSLLMRYAFLNEEFKEIISTSKYKCKSSVKSYLWYNRVSILDDYRYSLGGKNGYTPDAGKTLISYARKDDVTLGIVTLNDGDIYNNQIKLFNEYFDEYSKYKIIDKDKFYIDKNLFKDDVYIKEDFYYLLSRDELDKITTLISIYNDESLEVVGNISIKLNNTEIGNLDIYRNKKKKQLSFFQRIKNYLLDIL
ncbi:MAG: D-alanyl-D-alanine carboxypeptidase [Bacilli bacterium]|nr:D-alanyl-D-alanine carboxypeptidase [Bacilli bacterium]